MFRLAHLSDIHLGPLPDVTYRDLFNKRITGYVNWQRNRRRFIGDETLNRITDHLLANAPDHVALTGDLVNLALDAEIEAARLWLEAFGEPHFVSVVPGNHDAYVPGALDKTCRAWGPWMSGDETPEPVTRHAFPWLRRRGPLALIGVSSARASAPFMANGWFRKDQSARMAEHLETARAEGLFPVVMIHHPPVRGAAAQHKRLYGISLFQKVMREHGHGLVLHGHTHVPSRYAIEGRDGRIPVIGVPAGGQSAGGHKPPARYNLFEIDGEPGRWSLVQKEFGITGHAGPATLIATHDLTGELA